jgi:hypothetical protein
MFAIIEAEKATNTELSITAACRFFGVSTSGFHEWRHAQADPRERRRTDRMLCETIREIHRQSRGTYGAPRVHAELRLGLGVRVGRKRVERLMRADGLQGVTRRRRRGTTRRDPHAVPNDDLVARQFRPDGPNQLWIADITEHPTLEGKVYCAVVIDAWNRQVVGQSIADHLRAELVVDALDMACWRQKPTAGQTVHHSDHGTQPIHVLGVRATTPPRRPVGFHGHRRRRARQRRRGKLLRVLAKPSSSTATTGRRARNSHKPFSSGSRFSTTSTAGTRPSACSALCATQMRASPRPRHDRHHHTQPVRETGGTSDKRLVG